MADVVNNISSI